MHSIAELNFELPNYSTHIIKDGSGSVLQASLVRFRFLKISGSIFPKQLNLDVTI